MQKRTKILERLLAETAFEAAKSRIYADPAALLARNLTNEDQGLAHELLGAMLNPEERLELQANIEEHIHTASSDGEPNFERLFMVLCEQLKWRFAGVQRISTAHLLAWIAEQPTLVADCLHRRGITSGRILRKLEQLTELTSKSSLVAHPPHRDDLDAPFQPLALPQSRRI